MANYAYQSSSYSSGGGADAAFNAADVNSDGRVDLGEFRNFVGRFSFQSLLVITNDYYYFQDKTSAAVLVMVLVHHHSNHHRMVVVLVSALVVLVTALVVLVSALVVQVTMLLHLVLVLVLVSELEVQATNHPTQAVVDMVLMLLLLLVLVLVSVDHHPMEPQVLKYNNMLLMLKASSLTTTHKSSVDQLLVVFKHTLKTSEFDSFNHHQSHLQV